MLTLASPIRAHYDVYGVSEWPHKIVQQLTGLLRPLVDSMVISNTTFATIIAHHMSVLKRLEENVEVKHIAEILSFFNEWAKSQTHFNPSNRNTKKNHF